MSVLIYATNQKLILIQATNQKRSINALVFSKLYYCSSVWSSSPACNVHKLQYVENFAVRIIYNLRKFDHISPVLRNLRKTNLYYRDATLTFKCMRGHAPEYFTSILVTRGSVNVLPEIPNN